MLGVALVVACVGASLAPAGPLYLTRLEEDRDPPGGSAEGLDGAHTVAASPDDKHVYVTGAEDDAVVTFKREASGALTRIEEDRDVQAGGTAQGLDAAEGVVVSPDGKHVYVTGAEDNAVITFKRNKNTGKLRRVEMDQDPSDGGNAEGLRHANAVAISPDGKHVYVTASDDDTVVTFKRNKRKGKLKRVEQDKDVSSGGNAEGLEDANGVRVAPNGKHVYVVASVDDAVVTFKRNKRTGKLKRLEEHRDVAAGGSAEGLDGADGLAISADGENVYVTGDEDDTVVTFQRATDGTLTRLEEDRDPSSGGSAEGLDGAGTAAVSFDGDYVYVGGETDDALVVFTRDEALNGELTRVEEHRDIAAGGGDEGLDRVRNLAVSPDDEWVYVTGRDDDAIVTFDRTIP